VVSVPLKHFYTLSHKRQDFRKKKKNILEHTMWVLISSTTFTFEEEMREMWSKCVLVFL